MMSRVTEAVWGAAVSFDNELTRLLGGNVEALTALMEQLRTAYDTIKKEYEPWQKLNVKPEQVTSFQGVYQKTFEEVASIGRQLGYPDEEIVEALQENPVATLDYLRREFQQAQQGRERQDDGRDLQELINTRVEEALAPINERENTRMTSEANSVFERTAYGMAAEMYRAEGIDVANVPAEEIDMILSATSEILKYDSDALRSLKYEGKTAGIKAAFQEAKTMLDKYYLARSGRSNGAPRPGAPPLQRGPNGQFQPGMRDGKKATLDDLMNHPELVNPKYAER